MGLLDTIKSVFSRNIKDKLKTSLEKDVSNYVKDKLSGSVEDVFTSMMNTKLFKDINYSLTENPMFDLKHYMLDRLTRYKEYDLIQSKIPEQDKQVMLYYDLVINPETYTQDFLNFDIYQDDSLFDFLIPTKTTKYDTETFLEKKTINLQTYLKIYSRKNNLYKIIKKQIHDQIFYGDGFIEILDPPFEEFKKLDKDVFVTNYLTYQSISPKRVVLLQIQNINLGYLVIPDEMTANSLNEQQLVIDFLLYLLKELDVDKFKSFTKHQVISETKYDLDEFQDIMALNTEKEVKELSYESIEKLRNLLETNVLYVNELQNVIKEQTVNSQMFKDKFTLVFQMDLTRYMSKRHKPGSSSEIEDLMAIDDTYASLFREQQVRYILPDRMAHITLTNYKYYPYGQGILDSVRSIQSLVLLLEYQMVIYRLTKAPDRRKYTIDVTGIQKEKIPEYINRIKNELKSIKTIDVNGSIQENLDLITLMEDYFILRKNGTDMVDIGDVPGQEMQKWYDDMKYWHDKLLSAIGIPPSYLGFQEGLSGVQTVLMIQDHRVQRQVIRMQSDLNEGLNALFFNTFKILNDINNQRKTQSIDETLYRFFKNNDIEIKLFAPTQLEQKEKSDLVSTRLSMIKDIQDMTGYRLEDLLTYFNIFTSSEISEFVQKKEEEERTKENEKKEKKQKGEDVEEEKEDEEVPGLSDLSDFSV